jgi:hypothetical protein
MHRLNLTVADTAPQPSVSKEAPMMVAVIRLPLEKLATLVHRDEARSAQGSETGRNTSDCLKLLAGAGF